MTQHFDIVMLALPRWDGPYSSTAYSLAKALSKHTRVFYVDNPFTLKDFISQRTSPQVQKRKNALLWGEDIFRMPDAHYPNLFAVTPRIVLPINWLPPGVLYDALSRLNDRIVSAAINRICSVFDIRRYVLVNSFNPLFGRFLDLTVKPLLQIYQSVDDISQSIYIRKHGTRLEREAIRRADFTIVTSTGLRRLKSQDSPNVFLLPNAADVSLFQKAAGPELPMPPEIRTVSRGKKIICYMGNICHRLDYDLLHRIAREYNNAVLLMIGPLSNPGYKGYGLDKMHNVIFTGSKRLEELPAYLQYSHCCIIPFLCNQLTQSIYPLKINEYLSAGKPVVTTNFSDDIRSFQKVVYVANNAAEFLHQIGLAMAEDTKEKAIERIACSAANNWESRARHFMEMTGEFLKHNEGRGRKTARGIATETFFEQGLE